MLLVVSLSLSAFLRHPLAQNIHIGPRKIWLTRPAESVLPDSDFDVGEGVEELTEEGRRYSMTVAKYLQAEQVGRVFKVGRLRASHGGACFVGSASAVVLWSADQRQTYGWTRKSPRCVRVCVRTMERLESRSRERKQEQ